MWTRTGKPIISAPHIYENLKHIFEDQPDLVLDGELYTSNKDVDFNTIISCVRKTKPTKEDLMTSESYIEFWMYDMYNGIDLTYAQRRGELHSISQAYELNYDLFPIVATLPLFSFKEIDAQLSDYIAQGFEGQILRVPSAFYENKRSKSLLKHKTFHDEEFTILAINEGIGKFANKAATITIKTQEGVFVDCTINGTMQYLEEVWSNRQTLNGKQATVKYFEKTVDGSLRFPKVINIDRLD
jgi:ATP-dependent DNA ligase